MKIRFLILLVLIFGSGVLYSQTDTAKFAQNIMYIEAAGVGGYGSINYERVIFCNRPLTFAFRVGIGTYHIKDYTNKFNPDVLIPVSVYSCYGKSHKIELGIGQTFTNIVQANVIDFEPTRVTAVHTNLSMGYRYQQKQGGFFFRAAYTPILEFNRRFRNWGGIAFGYAF